MTHQAPQHRFMLRLVHWNANGLHDQGNEFRDYIQAEDLDIMCVNETHLKEPRAVKVANYKCYRNDRVGPGGGTAIYVRSGLSHYVLPVPPLTCIEATAIVLETGRLPIVIVSVYNPPGTRADDLRHDLQVLFNLELLVADRSRKVIIAGDLNCKHRMWNCRNTNSQGKTLYNFLARTDYVVQAPTEPTHFSAANYRPDVLDICLLKGFHGTLTTSTSVPALDSDHNPVLVEFNTEIDLLQRTRRTINWHVYRQHMLSSLGPIPPMATTQELEAGVRHFTESITASTEAASHTATVHQTSSHVSQHLRQLIAEKRRARRAYQTLRDPASKRTLTALSNKVKRLLATEKNDSWKHHLESLSTQDTSLWRTTKSLLNHRSHLQPLHGTQGLVYTPADQAEALADSLERQCRPYEDHADPDFQEYTEGRSRRLTASTPAQPDDGVKYVGPGEIRQIVRFLKHRKAPGIDGISNADLKQLPRRGLAWITAISNAVLRLRHFPAPWKHADVIMIPKPGQNPVMPQNYRPISLLSSLGKVIEKTILTRLQTHVEEAGVLDDEQFGFRAHHSCPHQLLRVVELITAGFNAKQHTTAVFVDVAKAFDQVWHAALISKMGMHDFPAPLLQLVGSYLHHRSFNILLRTGLQTTRSTTRPIEAGVPQGSLLSPLLYALFVQDIPNTVGISIAKYADDTAFLSQDRHPLRATLRLQRALADFEEWCSRWQVQVNAEKSQAVFFSRRRPPQPAPVLLLDTPLPWTPTVKYLGLIMDRKLTWGPHIKDLHHRAQGRLNSLSPLIHHESFLSPANKLLLYKVIIRPLMTYASPVWGYAAKTHLRRLQGMQNKIIRHVAGAPWFVRNTIIHRDLNIPSLRQHIRHLATRLYDTLPGHPNPLIANLGSYNHLVPTTHPRPKSLLRPLTPP